MAIPAEAFQVLSNRYSGVNNALGGLAGGPLQAPSPGVQSLANSILLNAQQKPISSGGTINPNNQPSVMSRLFDILSRPNYAAANFVKGEMNGSTNPIGDIISGLAGTQKTTFSDVLKQAGMTDSTVRSTLGTLLDVGLDPTTYISGKGIVDAGKNLLNGGKAAAKVAPEIPLAGQMLKKGDPINPEVYGLKAETPAPPVPTALVPPAESGPINVPKDVLAPPTGTPPVPVINDTSKLTPVGGQLPLDLPVIKNSAPAVGVKPLDVMAASADPIKGGLDTAGAATNGVSDALKAADDLSANVKGQLPMKFKDFNVSKIKASTIAAQEANKVQNAKDILGGIAQGNIADALKIVPPPPISFTPRDSKLADQIIKGFDPSKATAEINKQFPNTLNAKQQVKLYYSTREALNKLGPMSARRTNAVYRAVEANMRARGYIPRIGTGENVSLSDVISHLRVQNIPTDYNVLKEFGDKINPASPVGQAVEAMRARGAIRDSVHVNNIAQGIAQSKANIMATNTISDTQMKNVEGLLKKFGKASTQAAGVSPAGQKATKSVLAQAMTIGKSPAMIVLEQKSKMLDDIIAGGKTKRTEVNDVVTKALEKNLGKLPAWSINDNKAVEWIGSRISTWYGQADLREATLQSMSAADATAKLRGRVLATMFKDFDPAQATEAFHAAQGVGKASTPEVHQLAAQISTMMEDLAGKTAGRSVLTRSAVDMGELNKWMRRYNVGFEFRKGRVKHPLTGETFDFSKGTDWLDSWKVAAPKGDAPHFMFKFQQGIESALREKAVFDELGERFGSKVAGNGFRVKISGHPYLDGYHFTEDIAKQIPRMVKDWNPVGLGNSPMLKLYDRGLSMWKSNVTILRPGFHIRNVAGDMYMGMLDGVNSVKPYRLAFKVQRFMKGAYPDLNDIDKLVEMGVASKSSKTPVPGEVLFRNKSGVPFTAEQIAAAAHQRGLLEDVSTIEDIMNMGNRSSKKISITRPFGGRVQALGGSLVELQTHNARLAHFIDKTLKSSGTDFPKIFDSAAQRARTFHPTGLDLTDFEKKYLRRIMPFYSWLRKSSPILLQGIVMRPGVTLLPAKINQGIQEANGINTDRSNPFPTDQMFPQWIRDMGMGPLSTSTGWLSKFSDQIPPGYVMGGTGLDPLVGLVNQMQNPGQTISSSLSPALQIPIELMTGKRLFNGQAITGVDAAPGALQEYLGQQIPDWSIIQGLTGVTPFGTQTAKNMKSAGQSNVENIMDWLTGAGIKGTGPYVREAKYEMTRPITLTRLYGKYNALAQIQNQDQGGG